MDIGARSPSSIEVSAVVIRADGTTHNLGVVSASYSWRKPLKKLLWPLHRNLANERIRRANQHSEGAS